MTETKQTIFVAIISRIRGLDRMSFSQTINHIVEKHPDYAKDEGSWGIENGVPPQGHILNAWVADLDKSGVWHEWMSEATDITLYHMFLSESINAVNSE